MRFQGAGQPGAKLDFSGFPPMVTSVLLYSNINRVVTPKLNLPPPANP